MGSEQPGQWSARDEHIKRMNEKLTRELGPLVMGFLQDPSVTEIMLNPDGKLWVEQHGKGLWQCGEMAGSQARSLMSTVAATLNTTITADNPILECELPIDGSRFEALIPPSVAGPSFTIRRKALQVFTLADYVAKGIISDVQCAVISEAVRKRSNILVVGGTGSGKTTLSNAIIHEVVQAAPDDRLVIIEDTGELQCSAQNVVALRAVDHVNMTRLLKATMRLRPDRIIVGEVRDGAALDLLMAWNTGHPGGVATIHANSAVAGLSRLELLVSMATQAPMQVLIAEAVNLIVYIEKTNEPPGRRVKSIVAVSGFDGQTYQTTEI